MNKSDKKFALQAAAIGIAAIFATPWIIGFLIQYAEWVRAYFVAAKGLCS